ncbi:glycosyltransferase family protein [Methanocaldococcus indicus]|uniref:glycosyltransferase family protein n=1 Tax=Methanocaldococcus indicus TaxID=213231 RepID=UPI003C6CE3F6
MKILLLDTLHSHYLKNTLYIGLKKILGENIDIFPLPNIDKESFTVKYDKKDISNWKKIKENIDNNCYDYIIIGCLNDYIANFIRYILENSKKNIIIIDFDDIPYIRKIIFSNKVLVYFKREKLINDLESYIYLKKHLSAVLYHNSKILFKSISNSIFLNGLYLYPTNIIKNEKIRPIPLGIVNLEEHYPILKNIKKKDYDVSFIATPNTKERKIIFSILTELEKEYDIKCYTNKGSLRFEDYLKIIASSKISINTYGYGVDTFRYYEIPYLKTMLLTKKPIIEIPNNFINGKSAVFYNNVNEIRDLIFYHLENNRWKKIAKEGNAHVNKYFLDKKLAQYFLNIIEGEINE